ncbi:MAG: DUF1232 domain-containing protein [Acidobacteriota bacterium]
MTERRKMKKRMKELLLFIPNLLKLLLKLLRDPRVSSADKAIVAGTIVYVIAPIDVIPDFIPFIGLVDDSYLIGIAVLRLLNRADRNIIMEHWRGTHDVKELVSNLSRVASFFLPERIKNVLHGRIEPRAKANLTVVSDAKVVNE